MNYEDEKMPLNVVPAHFQVEAVQEEKQALLDAHVAEMELQSGQYADLAAKLRRAEALISAQEHQLTAAQVRKGFQAVGASAVVIGADSIAATLVLAKQCVCFLSAGA